MVLVLLFPLSMMGKVVKTVDEDEEARFRAYYLESVCQREKGNRAAQFDLLHRALMIRPEAPEAVFDFADAVASTGTVADSMVCIFYDRAIELARKQKVGESQLLSYVDTYANYLMNTGNMEQAVPYLEELAGNSVKREKAYKMLMICYDRLGRYEDELNCQNKFIQYYGDDEEILQAKVGTLRDLNRYDEAISFVDTLLQRYPTNINYSILKAETYLQNNDTTAGRQMYEKLAEIDSTSPRVQQLMYIYFSKTRQPDKCFDTLKKMVLNERVPMENRIGIMRDLVNYSKGEEEGRKVKDVFNRLMEQPLDSREIPDMYGRYLASVNAPETDFSPVMHKILEIEPGDLNARLFVIQDALASTDYELALNMCKEGLQYHDKELRFYMIGGTALNMAGKPQDAKAFFEEGMACARNSKDKERQSSFYSSYADILHAVGEEERSYLYYDTAFVYNPANVVALNNYAYFLSLKGENIDKAQTMIEKVMRMENDNPTYLDTYAWILFVRKDYKGARMQIDEALQLIKGEPGDGSLYDHAGDIYYHLGMQKEAVEFWRKAEELNCENKVLKTKIKTKKYVADETK